MRSFIVVAGFAALFAISNTSSSNAASAGQRAHVTYSSSSNASNMSRVQQEPVPANCIRQECGKLWCWNMSGGKGGH